MATFVGIVRATGDRAVTERHGSAVFVFEPSHLPTPLFVPPCELVVWLARLPAAGHPRGLWCLLRFCHDVPLIGYARSFIGIGFPCLPRIGADRALQLFPP